MPDKYELPMIESDEVATWVDEKGKVHLEPYKLRQPDFQGAVPTSWGQQEDLGATMVLLIDAPAEELSKLGGFKKN